MWRTRNCFGPVALLEGLRPALERSGAGRAVVISSNSASTVPLIDDSLLGLLTATRAPHATTPPPPRRPCPPRS
nr:hypothetical protein OG284_31210 [Streptomyces sp. NBC_01177]